ncbi:protein kinase [Nocardia sp. NPDC050435]|uniref:serine/threonine-protein kinase n=1 Tax=Nocardia sp. NPDC050435 TaxID=3155040 RepID=UPI0033CE1666
MLRAGEVFAGYTVKRVLGQGGMGTVYLAQHPRLPRLTALKLLDRELYADDEIRQRFEREADLVAQLDHPNIVTVYDRGAEDDQLWISMQFVSGSDAAGADVDALAPARAVHIIADTAAALDFAHANGVLHRDVKPANILLAKAPIGQPERVLLTDFGIAAMRNSDNTLSSVGQITATLAYAAPEQLSGTALDHRADQYSLACTLFWMLTGAPPFGGGNPAVVMNGHLFGPVPSLRRARPGLPPALDGVLARALAKRPDDRFPSCVEFAVAARRALAATGPHQHSMPRHVQPGPHTGYPPGYQPQTGYAPPHPGYGPPPTRGYPGAAPHPGNAPRPTGAYRADAPPTGAYPGNPPYPVGPHQGPLPTGSYQGPPPNGPYRGGSLPPGGPHRGSPPPTGAYPGNSSQPGGPQFSNMARPTGAYQGNPPRPSPAGSQANSHDHGQAGSPGAEGSGTTDRPTPAGAGWAAETPPTSGRPDSGRNPLPPSGTEPPRPIDLRRSPERRPDAPASDSARPPSGTRRTARPITIALPDAPIRRPRPPTAEPGRTP